MANRRHVFHLTDDVVFQNILEKPDQIKIDRANFDPFDAASFSKDDEPPSTERGMLINPEAFLITGASEGNLL